TNAPASAKPAATPIQSDSAYAAGTFNTGDEGLMIGVCVSDIAMQTDSGYWGLTADASDEDIWAALTRPLVSVDVSEQESAYIYDTTEDGRKKLGSISGLSQGVNVVAKREDGWSLVEAFRNEDGAFIRGYIRSNKLRTVEVNQTYGMVIDKNTQTLTVYKDGERLGSCQVSTGLPTKKYLHRETPAGEFMTVTRRGTIEYYGKGFTKYTIRLNGSYYLCEIPTTKKNGSTFLDEVRDQLGNKATRGNICVAHEASSDGGINAEWIWNMTDDNKKVKVLIFDDKARTDVPVGE
ncbi:MAG: L,D-transpeptidase, partial [Clostridia bacterium]|nr:L,D-transpeptidase [Clostridia bacterium]